jgi:Beta-lactamase class C and other penicillin binding proteins
MNIEKIWQNWDSAGTFSGVFSAIGEKGIIFEKACGFRSRSEQLLNNRDTAFAIASGTKLFTGLAVCNLIDAGKLSLDTKLWDILPYDLGQIDKRVTIFQLLTHTSGIGDYLDEEDPNSYEYEQELCNKYPVYLWERLDYYLKMITPLPPKFEPGARFGYSNAGFVMLGLVVEAASGVPYQQFVTDEIIRPLNLKHTGFYRSDSLPANTAIGYLGDSSSLQTNIFSLPVIGGSDGGIFTCAEDLDTLWRSIFAGKVLSKTMLTAFLKPQVERETGKSYGLGVYMRDNASNDTAYYAIGGDFGVSFFTIHFPKEKITISALDNSETDIFSFMENIFSQFQN